MMDIVSTVYVLTHKQTSCICVRAKKIEKKKTTVVNVKLISIVKRSPADKLTTK